MDQSIIDKVKSYTEDLFAKEVPKEFSYHNFYHTSNVVAALDTLYEIWDAEVGAEGFSDQRFVRQLDQLLTHIRKEPDSYGLTDFSLNY